MSFNFKDLLRDHVINSFGWKTDYKIIVFESDDWGSMRMPNHKTYQKLLQHGIRVDKSLYDTLDSLEKKIDVERLIEVLIRNKSKRGLIPIFTCNMVMGNPDYEAIKNSNFEKYFHRNLFESYNYYYNEDLYQIWNSAVEKKILKPQFHAREHLNVPLWMSDLKNNLPATRFAFNNGFYGLKTITSSRIQNNYLAAYYAESFDQLEIIKMILENGMKLFRDFWGMSSKSFVATNYILPKELELFLKSFDVDFIQTQYAHLSPNLQKNSLRIVRHFSGQRNINNQIYLVRNVMFEPYLNQNKDWVNFALRQISTAFYWKKPAIICTHRINYASNMSMENSNMSFNKLHKLLIEINRRWPDVRFMTSDELGEAIAKNK